MKVWIDREWSNIFINLYNFCLFGKILVVDVYMVQQIEVVKIVLGKYKIELVNVLFGCMS